MNIILIENNIEIKYQHKLSFVVQLSKVDFTRKLYDYLNEFYDRETIPVYSFFKSIRKIREVFVLDVNERKKILLIQINYVFQDFK